MKEVAARQKYVARCSRLICELKLSKIGLLQIESALKSGIFLSKKLEIGETTGDFLKTAFFIEFSGRPIWSMPKCRAFLMGHYGRSNIALGGCMQFQVGISRSPLPAMTFSRGTYKGPWEVKGLLWLFDN